MRKPTIRLSTRPDEPEIARYLMLKNRGIKRPIAKVQAAQPTEPEQPAQPTGILYCDVCGQSVWGSPPPTCPFCQQKGITSPARWQPTPPTITEQPKQKGLFYV